MPPKREEHLKQVEAAVQAVRPLLANHQYQGETGTVIVAGIIDQMIEHHEAILILIRQEKIGSAFAMARLVVEGVYRGLWINKGATEEQVKRFEKEDKIDLRMIDLAKANDQTYQLGKQKDFFEDFKNRSWDALNSYTHTGMMQLGRRYTGQQLQPAYTEQQVYEITTTLTTLVLVLVSYFFAVRGLKDDCDATDKLTHTYGPLEEKKQQ
jgi:hypothetical protein